MPQTPDFLQEGIDRVEVTVRRWEREGRKALKRVRQEGRKLEVYANPATSFVAAFVGSANRLFGNLTVRENLQLATFARKDKDAIKALATRLESTASHCGVPEIESVAARLGDVAVVARDAVSYHDPDDSGPFELICRHGSMTAAEVSGFHH